jgi:signal transduction histidine kinase
MSGTKIRQYYIGKRFESVAKWMANEIQAGLSAEVSDAKSLALTPTLLQAVENSNRSYEGKSREMIAEEIMRIDGEWQKEQKIDDTIRTYLSNPVSNYLHDILRLQSQKYAEIFVTDEQGALVGATGKTTDFYQADEEWWDKAFNKGNGRSIIQGVDFDESVQTRTITIAVPVRDPASNTVMGVLKVLMKADYLFGSVNELRMEEKGYAGVTTRDQRLLATSAPAKTNRVPVNFWKKIIDDEQGVGWTNADDELGERNVVGFAVVDTSEIDAETLLTGIEWYVFLYQDIAVAYALINKMAWQVFGLGLGLLLISSLLGFFATNWIVMPIRLLREEAQYIARGDLGRKVEIRTNDEIEQLAEEINIMSAKLKETQADLEQRIEERTTELSEANKRLEAQREVLLKVNKQLMKASTLKSEFLADICDGLNNPVSNIKRLAETVLEKVGDRLDETQRDYLDDIRSNAKHLSHLIDEVLTLAKATAGKIELNLSRFAVKDVLHEVYDTVKTLATERNIKFQFNIAEDLEELTADPNLFKHIIFNLYTNAIKFNRLNGSVAVSSSMADGSLEVSVADTGIGIREEDQERIFYEFEKIELAQTPYYEGAGMGLALAQRFVEMHGGEIWVESEYGKGSTFKFRIPLRQEQNR